MDAMGRKSLARATHDLSGRAGKHPSKPHMRKTTSYPAYISCPLVTADLRRQPWRVCMLKRYGCGRQHFCRMGNDRHRINCSLHLANFNVRRSMYVPKGAPAASSLLHACTLCFTARQQAAGSRASHALPHSSKEPRTSAQLYSPLPSPRLGAARRI